MPGPYSAPEGRYVGNDRVRAVDYVDICAIARWRVDANRTVLVRLRTESLGSNPDIENSRPETAREIGRLQPEIWKIAPERLIRSR